MLHLQMEVTSQKKPFEWVVVVPMVMLLCNYFDFQKSTDVARESSRCEYIDTITVTCFIRPLLSDISS